MKVYITYEKDGLGGREVDAVFKTREIAQDWIIKTVFSRNDYYKSKQNKTLRKMADELISEYEVIEN